MMAWRFTVTRQASIRTFPLWIFVKNKVSFQVLQLGLPSPGVNDEVQRHARIKISYMQTEESNGLRAVCHQHEIDQLNGLFWINRSFPPQARADDQAV